MRKVTLFTRELSLDPGTVLSRPSSGKGLSNSLSWKATGAHRRTALGSLYKDDGDGSENGKKPIGLD